MPAVELRNDSNVSPSRTARNSFIARSSKYRHIYGTDGKKDQHIEDLRIATTVSECSNLCSTNAQFVAIPWDSACGGSFTVFPVGFEGRTPAEYPLFRGHSASVLDLDFCPFNERLVCSGSEDCTLKLWSIDEDFTSGHGVTGPLATLEGHGRKIQSLKFHPTASNVLASSALDKTLRIWDVSSGQERIKTEWSENFCSVAFNWTGAMLGTTGKDRQIRLIDSHSGRCVAEVMGHQGYKTARFQWLGGSEYFTTAGFSRTSERQLFLWDRRMLNASQGPTKTESIDNSAGLLMPFFDGETGLLFLAGKGDGNIRYWEFTDSTLYYIGEHHASSAQKGMAMLPKRSLNVMENEIVRFYKAGPSHLEPISFRVPRREEHFQADIYPPTIAGVPSITGEQFFTEGLDAAPIMAAYDAETRRWTPIKSELGSGHDTTAIVAQEFAIPESNPEPAAKVSDTAAKIDDTSTKISDTSTKISDTSTKINDTAAKIGDTSTKISDTSTKIGDPVAREDSDYHDVELKEESVHSLAIESTSCEIVVEAKNSNHDVLLTDNLNHEDCGYLKDSSHGDVAQPKTSNNEQDTQSKDSGDAQSALKDDSSNENNALIDNLDHKDNALIGGDYGNTDGVLVDDSGYRNNAPVYNSGYRNDAPTEDSSNEDSTQSKDSLYSDALERSDTEGQPPRVDNNYREAFHSLKQSIQAASNSLFTSKFDQPSSPVLATKASGANGNAKRVGASSPANSKASTNSPTKLSPRIDSSRFQRQAQSPFMAKNFIKRSECNGNASPVVKTTSPKMAVDGSGSPKIFIDRTGRPIITFDGSGGPTIMAERPASPNNGAISGSASSRIAMTTSSATPMMAAKSASPRIGATNSASPRIAATITTANSKIVPTTNPTSPKLVTANRAATPRISVDRSAQPRVAVAQPANSRVAQKPVRPTTNKPTSVVLAEIPTCSSSSRHQSCCTCKAQVQSLQSEVDELKQRIARLECALLATTSSHH